MDPYLTTKELAALLRVKERKVYELAAEGAVPCTKATGKLLFPRAEVDAWLAAHRTGPELATPRPAVLLGSHDPLLDWAIRESRSGLATLCDGSADGLARFQAGEGVAAGLHLYGAEAAATGADPWNAPALDAALTGGGRSGLGGAVLLTWAARRRGVLHRRDAARPVRALADLVGLRVAHRQAEAGAQRLLEHLLADAGVDLAAVAPALVARSETEAALAVAEGRADACFGLEAAAQPYGLAFTPVIEERFDLLVDRRAYFEPPLQALFAFAQTQAFRERAAASPGYATDALGAVRWNGPAG